jgi:Yip1 domain
MTDGVELAAPAPPQQPEPKPNSLSRIAGVFFAPGETFASIVRRPDFVVPLVILLVVSLLTGILVAQKVDFKELARDTIESQPRAKNLSPDIIEKQVNMTAGFMKVASYGSPVFSILLLVILAAILFAAFKIFGGEGEYLQALSITIYAWYPNLIRAIVSVAALFSKKTLTMYTLQNPVASNIGYFINPKLHPIAAAFWGSIDLFTIWTLILLIIGFAAMSRFSRMKSAVIILSLWAVKILFSVGAGAMQALQARMK